MAMIHGLRSHDRYVYHYTKSTTARDFILKDQSLRLGRFALTNDPKEAKDWEFSALTHQNRDLSSLGNPELSLWFSAALKQNARLACFSLDAPTLTGEHVQDILKRGFSRPRMWDQYGDKHRGVCLVFDRAKLLDAVSARFAALPWIASAVHYNDQGMLRAPHLHEYMVDVDALETLGRVRYVTEHLQTHHKPLFFEKLSDWRDEREWRIVVFADADSDLFAPIDDALIGVIHGTEIDPAIADELATLAPTESFEHMRLLWKNGAPWYDVTGALRWPVPKSGTPRAHDRYGN